MRNYTSAHDEVFHVLYIILKGVESKDLCWIAKARVEIKLN